MSEAGREEFVCRDASLFLLICLDVTTTFARQGVTEGASAGGEKMSKAAQFQVEIDIERRYKYVTKKEAVTRQKQRQRRDQYSDRDRQG